jgi:hypothetical protein
MMQGGTYSEALKVGFTEKQAGMLSRLGMETRNEAVAEIVFQQGLDWGNAIRKNIRDSKAFLFGVLIGILITRAATFYFSHFL